MKLKELFESEDSQKSKDEKIASEALRKFAHKIESILDKDDNVESSHTGNRISLRVPGQKFPSCELSYSIESRLSNKDTVTPVVLLSVNLGVTETEMPMVSELRKLIKDEFGYAPSTFDRPWYHKDHLSYSASDLEILKLQERPSMASSASSRYDPHQAMIDRRTPSSAARSRSISNHQFSGSIGGDSSNYRN